MNAAPRVSSRYEESVPPVLIATPSYNEKETNVKKKEEMKKEKKEGTTEGGL